MYFQEVCLQLPSKTARQSRFNNVSMVTALELAIIIDTMLRVPLY